MRNTKNLYRVGLLAVFIVINILILYGISQVVLYFNTGAERSSMLHLTIKNEQVYLPKTIWVATSNPGRPIEKQTLETLKRDYLKAWYIRNIAYKTNDPLGVDDYYTKNARKTIYEHIKDQKSKNVHMDATTLNHTLALDFYSEDGQLVILTDQHCREYQRIYKNGQLVLESNQESSYKVFLLLEDGFWKIRHIIKQEYQSEKEESVTLEKITETKESVHHNHNHHPRNENSRFHINGINYYPQTTPWNLFGKEFDKSIISKDFEIIKTAGLNTLRIFIPYKEFGKAVLVPEKLQKLKQLLDTAARKELKVVLTLFDFYGNYDILDWTLTHRHAEQLVRTFKNHPAILAWDIKNEPDLDFATRGKTNVLAWLKEMIHQIRAVDGKHPITIGWSNIEDAVLLEGEVDLVSFHYYEAIVDFEEAYKHIRSQTTRPLVLQEFGISSNFGLWAPFGASLESQAKYYQEFGEILQKYNIQNISWTLYDFETIPTSVVGSLPWRKYKQKHFGFVDKNGNQKPSFQFISN